ncbi:hypothetical protein [Sphingomonas sp. 10B4]|uniref:hypothetical protein n=1 Tax=Sphingomonas sp. 10B4 TaxID=3048575 RepID=UPI002B22C7F4|nr:hypothetical protein [Sphingomonas sp. 10B4]
MLDMVRGDQTYTEIAKQYGRRRSKIQAIFISALDRWAERPVRSPAAAPIMPTY